MKFCSVYTNTISTALQIVSLVSAMREVVLHLHYNLTSSNVYKCVRVFSSCKVSPFC